jgi:hypothetical protein
MEHIRIHLLLTHYKEKLHLSDTGIAQSLTEYYNQMVTLDDLSIFLASHQPKPKQVANALKAEGYTPTLIAEIMETSIHNVKYYLQNPGKAIYVNPFWQMKFDLKNTTVNAEKIIQTTIEQRERIQKIREMNHKN